MDAMRFDLIAKRLAGRYSRRRAIAGGAALAAAGLAAPAVAQDSTPAELAADGDGPMMLFVQSFQAGSVVPSGSAGRFTLTLEQGLGHTIYFSDRPERIVGSMPTPQFLSELGFSEGNPPNAALVVETDEGQTELAVLQLYKPDYDEPTRTATYEVSVLEQWGRRGDQFTETDADLDLAEVLPTFGAAHLFIDDYDLNGEPVDFCPQGTKVTCWANGRKVGELDWFGVCEARNGVCQGTFLGQQSFNSKQTAFNYDCNRTFSAACNGNCVSQNTCTYNL